MKQSKGMLVRTHEKIFRAVAKYLGLDERFVKEVNKSLSRMDERRLGKHHIPLAYSYGRILSHIWSARMFRLRNDMVNCAEELGAALHLLHDSLIPSPKTGRKTHSRLEREVDYVPIPIEAIKEGFRDRPKTFKELKSMILRSASMDSKDPRDIVYLATYLTISITSCIVKETTPPREILEKIYKHYYHCTKIIKIRTLKQITILIYFLLLMLTISLTFFQTPLEIVIALLATSTVLTLASSKFMGIRESKLRQIYKLGYGECTEMLEEAAWFGIKPRRDSSVPASKITSGSERNTF